jgi:intracellular septation protein A
VKQALRQLLGDFLSAILFLVVYALSGDLFAAAIAVAAGVAQLARIWQTGRVEPTQWMSATMLTQSPRFIMVKPTIVHFAVAAVMLRRGWTLRYLPEIDTTY